MTDSTAPFIRLTGISKSFPGVRALDNVSLDINAGEVHSLTGENGSGKSTLAKIVNGSHQPDAGTIEIDGVPMVITKPSRALELGIVSISQELTLAPSLSVAENIFLGRMPQTRWGTVDWDRCVRDTQAVLDDLRVHVSPHTMVRDLSLELQQEVEIARAISTKARLLILDEATSSLSEAATDRLLEIVEEQRDRGTGVLMISHRMPELYRSCSVASVLRDGRLMGTVPLPETPEGDLVRLMVGRDLDDYFGTRDVTPDTVALKVTDLHTLDGALLPTSFEVRRGEILGVAGLVGSGKAELGMALGGAIPAEGSIEVAGRKVTITNPRQAIGSGIGYVPDDRKGQAILPNRSVAENFALAWRGTLSKLGVLRIGQEAKLVRDGMTRYGVVAANVNVKISTLSGGNQQKVVLGRTFARGCDVFVLSEPTRGIDVGSKSQVYALLQEQVSAGAAVVLISSELPEILGLADRVIVFHRGSVHAELDAEGLDEETVAAVAVSGHPQTTAA
ncbi:sugar ABC transporter ATP-binding protein [Pseudonocardia sp. NPDC049635]|uniref:sugar ABC transporter ATP-binding protein n=1 Tax=Pseudonocardia sp. NPDC049635 TaxID=3155506 RepID=UPI0033E6C885